MTDRRWRGLGDVLDGFRAFVLLAVLVSWVADGPRWNAWTSLLVLGMGARLILDQRRSEDHLST